MTWLRAAGPMCQRAMYRFRNATITADRLVPLASALARASDHNPSDTRRLRSGVLAMSDRHEHGVAGAEGQTDRVRLCVLGVRSVQDDALRVDLEDLIERSFGGVNLGHAVPGLQVCRAGDAGGGHLVLRGRCVGPSNHGVYLHVKGLAA